MPNMKKLDRTTIFNLLKLIWGVLIFYFWLKLCVPSTVEEDFVSQNIYDWYESSTADELDEDFKSELWKHEAPLSDEEIVEFDEESQDEYKIRFENICESNKSFCDKIVFNGSHTYKDKYMYLASSIYILRFIENNIQIWLPIKNQLVNIIINPAINSRRWFAFWTSIGAPSRLADYDIDDRDFEGIIEHTMFNGRFGNFNKLDREDVRAIITASL